MAQLQNMFDFPPAPKLNALGRLDPAKATQNELRGETLFFGKAQCATCHIPPFYLDNKMHDLKLERFVNEPPDGPIKTFTLRGIKDRKTREVFIRQRARRQASKAGRKRKRLNVVGNTTLFLGKLTSLSNRIPSAGLDNMERSGRTTTYEKIKFRHGCCSLF